MHIDQAGTVRGIRHNPLHIITRGTWMSQSQIEASVLSKHLKIYHILKEAPAMLIYIILCVFY